jgi:hypothetical protein
MPPDEIRRFDGTGTCLTKYCFQWPQKCLGRIRMDPQLLGLPDPDLYFRITDLVPTETSTDAKHTASNLTGIEKFNTCVGHPVSY